jgi:hypothetical protein
MPYIYKVTFEMVSPFKFPECYRNEKPAVRPSEVSDVFWYRVVNTEGDILEQFKGLKELIAQGELIRNPQLYRIEVVGSVWEKITPC